MKSLLIEQVFQAAKSGDASQVKELLDIHPELAAAENQDGLTLLGFTAHYGYTRVVQVLLEHGAEVNTLSHSKISFIPSNTALHAAIAGERDREVIELLLNHGADTNLFDSNGHTCLHTAVFQKENSELISLLIAYKADVNAKAPDGETPLALALRLGNSGNAELLRQYGATE